MMWDRFYECVDLFKMGDWWYLVYSEKHASVRRVQYFKGRTLDELKACTANDAGIWPDSHEGFLDSRGFYAGKTASDGTNRYIWGWCPTRPGNNNTDAGAAPGEPEWGGNLVMHRLIQHSDGTLTLGEVKGIADSFGNTATTEAFTLEAGNYKLLPRLNNQVTRISMTITTSQPGDRFGFSFVRGSDSKKYYSVIVNPENETTRKVNFEEEGDLGIGFINGTDGYPFPTPADGIYHVTITIDNSVLTMYINDNVAYTNRIYGIYRNCWSVNSYNGSILVSDMTVSTR